MKCPICFENHDPYDHKYWIDVSKYSTGGLCKFNACYNFLTKKTTTETKKAPQREIYRTYVFLS